MKLTKTINHAQVQVRPIILGAGINALGLIRSFGENGITPILISPTRDLAFYSKYSESLVCPDPLTDPDLLLQFLLNLNVDTGILFCTSDSELEFLSTNQDKLQAKFIYPMARWEILERCINKSKMYSIATNARITIPKTQVFESSNDIISSLDLIKFPIILKPANTPMFMEALGLSSRTLEINSKNSLLDICQRISKCPELKTELIIQERISGHMSDLFTISAYCNKASRIIAWSVGHKIRQHPPQAGTIMSGRVILDKRIKKIFDYAQRLVSALSFFGICNIEFMWDSDIHDFILIEINPRPGKWNYSATASGVNLPMACYDDVIRCSKNAEIQSYKEIVWADHLSDFVMSTIVWRLKGFSDYTLNPLEWFNTLRGKKVDAVFNIRDIKPTIYHIAVQLIDGIRYMFKKIKSLGG